MRFHGRGRIKGRHFYLDLSFIFCHLGLWVSDLLYETLPCVGVPSGVALCPRRAPSKPCPVCYSPRVRGPEGSSLGGGWGKAHLRLGKGQAPVLAQGRECLVPHRCNCRVIRVPPRLVGHAPGSQGSHGTFDVRSGVGAMQDLEPRLCVRVTAASQALVTKDSQITWLGMETAAVPDAQQATKTAGAVGVKGKGNSSNFRRLCS